MSEKKTSIGFFALSAKLAIKFGAKAIPALLKLAKFSKLSWIGSLGIYAVIFNWKFALMLIGSLFVHEYGHVWAMRREGVAVRGMYFIPFLGAAAVADSQFPSRAAEVRIALMGPLWGLTLAVATLGLYSVTQEPLLAAIAGWMALVNLFNLLPIMPLDGGRVFRNIAMSFSGWIGVALFVVSCLLAVWLSIKLGLSLILFVLAIGFGESILDLFRSVRRNRCLRAAKDLAPFLGVKPEPETVAVAIRQICHEHNEFVLANRCDCANHKERRDIGQYPWLSLEPFRTAVIQGWNDFLHLNREASPEGDERDWRDAHQPALRRPLVDLFRSRLQSAFWHADRNPDTLSTLNRELDRYDGTNEPLRTTHILSSGAAYIGLAVVLFALLYATKHVPGAEAAFNVFKD
ncbi:site-2 protease family protein [Candidatus Uhrbacteria bacterium]|nr:site-2 protease family protein [Candidatus Uhrbacteria bacterium]